MAFSNGKKYGQPICTERRGTCKKARTEVIAVGAQLIEEIGMVVPGADIMFFRTRAAKSIIGGHHGMSPWDLGWTDRRSRIRERMGRRDIISQLTEMNEIESQDEPCHYWFFEDEVYDFDFSDTSIDYGYGDPDDIFFDDEPEIDPEIVELMDGHPVNPNEVCRSIDAWRHSPDLGDNFDDEPEYIGYWS